MKIINMIKWLILELEVDLKKYNRILNDYKNNQSNIYYPKARLVRLWIELRATIQELNNWLQDL